MGELLQFHARLHSRPQRWAWRRLVIVLVLAVLAGFFVAGCEPAPDPFDALVKTTEQCIERLERSIKNTDVLYVKLLECRAQCEAQP